VSSYLHPGNLLHPANLILYVLGVGLLVLKVYALVDCTTRTSAAFVAHSKQTKGIWLGLLTVAVLLALVTGPTNFLGLLATVAAIVYLVDVKPAVTGSNSW
jgi:hypothetical protein